MLALRKRWIARSASSVGHWSRALCAWKEVGIEAELDGMEVKHPMRKQKAWEEASERRAFMDDLALRMNVNSVKDWKAVRAEDVKEAGGTRLLARYGHSVWKLLQAVYPEWADGAQPWTCRRHLPRGYWNDIDNRKAFLQELMDEKNISSPEDWSRVSVKEMREKGGSGLLSTYGGSISRLVNATLPHMELPARKSNTDTTLLGPRKRQREVGERMTPRRHRRCSEPLPSYRSLIPSRRREPVREVEEERELESCTQATEESRDEPAKEHEGEKNLEENRDRASSDWRDAGDVHSPRAWGFWRVQENQRRFLEMVKEKFDIREAQDWRRVGVADLEEMGGKGLVKRKRSVAEIVRSAYPEEQFSVLDLGKRVPAGWWNERANRREFMERLAAEQGVSKVEEWKRVTREMVVAAGGSRLLAMHGTVQKLLVDAFPELEDELSKAWMCRKADRSTQWERAENVKKFFDSVRGKCGVRKSSDWKRVSVEQLHRLGGGPLLRQHGGLLKALQVAYPGEEWPAVSPLEPKKSSQWSLLTATRRFFGPDIEVEEDAHPPDLLAAVSDSNKPGQKLELDIYLPKHALALEYNGQHHFEDVPFFGPVEAYRERDMLKRRLCEECGIRLLIVPYWWDMQLESLAAFLYNEVPSIVDALEPSDPEVRQLIEELKEGKHLPIAEEPPAKSSASVTSRSVRGMVLKDGKGGHAFLTGTEDPTGMLARERLDSIAVHWSGSGRALSYGHGKRLQAPSWWMAELPQEVECDGELWMGQGKLGSLIYRLFLEPGREQYFAGDYESPSEVDDAVDDELWYSIKFVATDSSEKMELGLEERLATLRETAVENGVFQVASYVLCNGKEHLEELLASSARLVLQDAKASYSFSKRDSRRCQVRRMEKDEVTVVGVSRSTRSLLVEVPVAESLSAAVQQSVRCSQAVYRSPPPPGTQVSVLHMGRWQSGRLKYPSMLH